ncbi:MAG: FHA domain-containing protein [Chloroflexaceae bacterium]|nr:FHA domain-containing protein [Chloroflexaceae bacterium]
MDATSARPRQEHFLIIEDNQARKVIVLNRDVYRLGRAKDCDIRIRSQFVSRHHATLYRCRQPDGSSHYQIRDGDREGRSSANGLLVNGRKVLAYDLQHGDKVMLGSQVFALYQCRQYDVFPSSPTEDPFDITLIDPAMVEVEDDGELV